MSMVFNFVRDPDTKMIYTNNKLTMKLFLVIYSIKSWILNMNTNS